MTRLYYLFICLFGVSCSSNLACNPPPFEEGKASWYEIACNGGRHTASGIPLDNDAMTAAHKTLPMGSVVKVINPANNRSIIVTITDRGPYKKGRVIDLTKGSFSKIADLKSGVIEIELISVKS